MSVIINSISSELMAITGLFIVKLISGSKKTLFNAKDIVLLSCLILLPIFIYNNIEYTYIYTLTIYTVTIITYKYILDMSFTKAAISCGLMILSIIILDFITGGILVSFMSVSTARNTWYISIILNVLYSTIMLVIFNKTKLKVLIPRLIDRVESRRQTKIVVFIILVIIALSTTLYTISINFKLNAIFTRSFLIFIIFFLLVIILFIERNSYDKLCDEYDNLFKYVKVFEDWIENEQLTRHEYKNQLAVLRCMTKEKEVKEKIDSIISGNINIDEQMISQLKYLPSGGFKGLLYYKIAVARNNRINIDVDISADVSTRLKKFNKAELEILSKLIGIYCDNAIEAAKETRKKIVVIEIYEYNKMVHVVISNTFNKKKDISRRYEKGVSTKRPGRGNGLYFANKLISKNKWIEEKQDIIDNFYIQKISVTKMVQNRKNGKKKKK